MATGDILKYIMNSPENTNPAILKQFLSQNGGLPPTVGSGKALVSVNGEWKEQEGYGWTEKGNQTVITWDGDTEGRETLGSESLGYKVSENGVPKSALVGVTLEIGGQEIAVPQEDIIELVPNVIAIGEAIVDVIDTAEFEGATVNKGLYFFKSTEGQYVSSLTYGTPDTVHKIDEKYLPASGSFIVNITLDDDDNYIADKTFAEIKSAVEAGISVKAKIVDNGKTLYVPLIGTRFE